MDPAAYVRHLRADGARLDAAAKGKLEQQVPTCPDWSMAGLVGHVASSHRWYADLVASPTSEGHWNFPEPPEDAGGLLAWYGEGLDELAAVLDADTTIEANASDLLLWLLNRKSADAPELRVDGDRKLLEAWRFSSVSGFARS